MNYWSNLKYMTRFAAVCLWNWYKERKGRVSFTLWRQLMGGVVQFHSAGWTCLNGLIQVNVITNYFLIYLFYQNIGFTIKEIYEIWIQFWPARNPDVRQAIEQWYKTRSLIGTESQNKRVEFTACQGLEQLTIDGYNWDIIDRLVTPWL